MTTKKRKRKEKTNPIPSIMQEVRVVGDFIVEPILYHSLSHGVYTSGIVDRELVCDKKGVPLPYDSIGEKTMMENPVIGKYKPIKPSHPWDELL